MTDTPTISSRIRNLAPSPTLALDAKIKQLQAQGQPIINLTLGEPDFDTPDVIKEAAVSAINDGFTHYTATAGIPELRQAVVNKLQLKNQLTYQPENIAIGVGSKQLLYHAFQVLCEPGAEVLLPVPTWSTFAEQIKLAGAKPVFVPLTAPFKLTAADLEPLITPQTKCLVINSPSNPTGAMIDQGELIKIADLAVKHSLWVIADEIYEYITYGQPHISIASLNLAIKERTITINGLSKAYAMTGWRLGYAAGPTPIIKAMIDLQGQTTSCATSIAQKAGVAALKAEHHIIEKMVSTFKDRRELVVAGLEGIKGLDVTAPDGAFYLFVGIKQLLNSKHPTSQAWCEALLAEQLVGVVPGEAFLAPGYFRLSYAAAEPDLKQALLKIKDFIG